ncbi:hypothetical protein EDB86DRAFT_3248737 [Lactarius hatsudake]|nr:hypothetical protein EDB86DRAFT_3248737 [Lactarius hatsudake]
MSPAPHTPENPGQNSHPVTPGSAHRYQWTTNGKGVKCRGHPYLNGQPCDADGYDLPNGTPPSPEEPRDDDDFFPYSSRAEFELADFLFRRVQMAGAKISNLMDIWAAYQQIYEIDPTYGPPFSSAQDLYDTIDRTEIGAVAWQAFSVEFDGDITGPGNPIPPWKRKSYEVWFRDPLKVVEAQIANKDYALEVDYAPKQMLSRAGKCQYSDFMSGNWAWEQADIISKDPETHGSAFVPVILGSDKTTVSVATGHNEYYPLYASIGNVQNHVRRAHRNAVSLVGFLAIPKNALFMGWVPTLLITLSKSFWHALYPGGAQTRPSNFDYDPTATFRSHTHTRLLKEAFEGEPRIIWDGYSIIDDVMDRACVLIVHQPFTTHFPQANIHELLSPDLLHQVIKGTFKDHLVEWVTDYLHIVHGKAGAKERLADIDQRIAAVPSFPGDDSKALMKVYLPAIVGYVPPQMVRAIAAFMEFCYLARQSQLDEDTLDQIDMAVAHFRQEREIFEDTGVREDFSLPRQHSISHYRFLIEQFGAPNGLCSSITESKHIKAVKEPWRRSSRNEPLGQMLLTNQRLDKLAATRVDLAARGLLDGPLLTSSIAIDPPMPRGDEGDVEAAAGITSMGDVQLARCPARGYPKTIDRLAGYVNQPRLLEHIRRFLYDQFHPEAEVCGMDALLHLCPVVSSALRIKVFHSAACTYHAPSDLSGIGGMHREFIRATPSWKKGPGRYDCVYVEGDSKLDGFSGLSVARVNLFFSFSFQNTVYPCALVQWFSTYGDSPCDETGLWRVKPEFDARRRRLCSVIHVDMILRSAHLIGVAGTQRLPRTFTHHDAFQLFYVNKYADHHAHEIAF